MARQSAKTIEANIHMLADRMMTLAGDAQMQTVPLENAVPDAAATRRNRAELLAKTAEIYELHTIALYDLDGQFIQGIDGAPERLDDDFLHSSKKLTILPPAPPLFFRKNWASQWVCL